MMAEGREFDLNYITERIIAVSFNHTCPEKTYLHNLYNITQMLQSKHSDNYMVRTNCNILTNASILSYRVYKYLLHAVSLIKRSCVFCPWLQVINVSEPREELRRINVRVKFTTQKFGKICVIPGHDNVSVIDIHVFSQVLDVGWPELHAPSLHSLCSLCKSIENWLNTHSEHVLLLHSRVSQSISSLHITLLVLVDNLP